MQKNTKNSRQTASDVGGLYEKYAASLRLFLGQQLRVKHRVEDLLHDIFEGLLRYPPVKPLISADSYAWRIAWRLVNAANRRVRQDGDRMATVARNAAEWVAGQPSTTTAEDVAERLASLERVKQGLAGLTPEERMAVVMVRFGYAYKEVAARMGISVEAVRAHLRRGFLTLKTSVVSPEQEQSADGGPKQRTSVVDIRKGGDRLAHPTHRHGVGIGHHSRNTSGDAGPV